MFCLGIGVNRFFLIILYKSYEYNDHFGTIYKFSLLFGGGLCSIIISDPIASFFPHLQSNFYYHIMDISSSHSDKEKQALLDKQQRESNQCHRRCNTMQFVLFSIVICGLAATLANVDRIIDKIVGTKDEITATYCTLGVYEGPNVSIPNDWHWGYDSDYGPSVWSKYYPQCGCDSQSPIDINRELVLRSMPKQFCSDSNSLLQWKVNANYTQKYNGTFKVFHNHHTIVMQPVDDITSNPSEPVAILKNMWQPINSSLHSEFVFHHMHFHWGGSQINQSGLGHGHYPLEAHFVHYSADYNSIQDALYAWRGLHDSNRDRYVLAVVAVFITVDEFSDVNNPFFDKLLKLQVNNSNTDMGFVKQSDLMDLLPGDVQSYYYYSGSLTTPPCDPVVRWHFLSTPLFITQVQWEDFVSLSSAVIEDNWRPQQNINNNAVYACDTDFVQTNYCI